MLGHGLDTSCGLVGPSLTQEHSLRIAFYVAWCTMWSNVCNCRYHLSHSQLLLATHTSLSYATLLSATLRNASMTSQLCENDGFSSEKKLSSSPVFSYQMFKNDGLHANSLVAIGEKVGWFWSQGGNLPKPQDHGPLHMLSLYVFFIRIDTNKCPFQPNDFGRTSLQGHCAWRPSSLNIASWSSFMPSPTSVMVSFISMAEARAWQLNESMDQLYEPKENGHKPWDAAEIPNPRHDELGGGPRLCPRLHTFISNPEVGAQVHVFYGLVHAERVGGPAELARSKGQVDSRLVGVSLQLCWTTCIVNWQFRMSRLSLMPTHVRSSHHHQPTLFYRFE